MNTRQYSWVTTDEEKSEEIQIVDNYSGKSRIFKLDKEKNRYCYSMSQEPNWQSTSYEDRGLQCAELVCELNTDFGHDLIFKVDFEVDMNFSISINDHYKLALASLFSSTSLHFENEPVILDPVQQTGVSVTNPFQPFLQESDIDRLITKVNMEPTDQKQLMIISLGDEKLRFDYDANQKLYTRTDKSIKEASEYRKLLKETYPKGYGTYFKVNANNSMTNILYEDALALQSTYPINIEVKTDSVDRPTSLTAAVHKTFLIVKINGKNLVFKYNEDEVTYQNMAYSWGKGEYNRKQLNNLFPVPNGVHGCYFKVGCISKETTITLHNAKKLCDSFASYFEFTDFDPRFKRQRSTQTQVTMSSPFTDLPQAPDRKLVEEPIVRTQSVNTSQNATLFQQSDFKKLSAQDQMKRLLNQQSQPKGENPQQNNTSPNKRGRFK